MNPKGRQAKGKARLSAYEKLLSQEAKEREEKLEKEREERERLENNIV